MLRVDKRILLYALVVVGVLIFSLLSLSSAQPTSADHVRSTTECTNDFQDGTNPSWQTSQGYLNCVEAAVSINDHGFTKGQCDNKYQDGADLNWTSGLAYQACLAQVKDDEVEILELSEECEVNPGLPECIRLGAQDYDGANNPIYERLNQVILFLSVGVGVAVTLSVIVASIQWSISGGDPQARGKAIGRLWNSGIALAIFVFGWLILNFLIPGGPL